MARWSTPNQNVFVKGLVTYSNLSKLTTGKALEKWNDNPYHKFSRNPFVSLQINHADILIPQNATETATDREMDDRLYEAKKSDPNGGKHYEGVNQVYFAQTDTKEVRDEKIKNHRLPWIAVTDGKSGHCTQYYLNEGEELAVGTPVIMCFRTFQSNSGNVGLAMNGVVVVAPENKIQTESRGDSIHRTLDALGLTLDPANKPSKLSEKELPTGATVDESKSDKSVSAPKSNGSQVPENPFPDDVVDDEDLDSNSWFSNDVDSNE